MSRTRRRLKASWSSKQYYIDELAPTDETRLVKLYRLDRNALAEGRWESTKVTVNQVPVYVWRTPTGKKLKQKLAEYHSDKDWDWTVPKSYTRIRNRKQRAQTQQTLRKLRTGYLDPDETTFPAWKKDAGWYYY